MKKNFFQDNSCDSYQYNISSFHLNYLFEHIIKGGCDHIIDAFINALSVFVSLNLAYASEVFQKQSCRPTDDGMASRFANSWGKFIWFL